MTADKVESDPLRIEFERVLQSSREEDVQSFLKEHPHILIHAFGNTWDLDECIPKFRFGAEFVSDFVLVTDQSSNTKVILVELEPPTARPFTRGNNYAKRLNGAMNQIIDWLGWVHDHDEYFRSSLGKAMSDPYMMHRITSEGCRRRLFVKAKIVIGRRSMLSEADNKRRATILDQHQGKLEIVPYDRLIDRMNKPSPIP